MGLWRLLVSLSVALLLVSCATLSKDECMTADWQLIGFEDGVNGSSPNRIGEHRQACAKHGITPDRVAYNRGYDEGILRYCNVGLGLSHGQNGYNVSSLCPTQSEYHQGYKEGLTGYCTYDSGLQQGLNGRSYRKVCRDEAEQDFLAGFDFGNHVHELQLSLRNLSADLDNTIDEQEENEEAIERTKSRITYDESLTVEQRRNLLEELEEYNELTVDLEAQHIGIEVEMANIERELRELGF